MAATFFLVYGSLKDRELQQRARTWLAALGGLTGVLATTQAYTSRGSYFWLFPSGQLQVFGPFQNQNNYAAFIELTLPLTLWEGLKPGRFRILWWIQAAVMAASVIFSGSRAGSGFNRDRDSGCAASRPSLEAVRARLGGGSRGEGNHGGCTVHRGDGLGNARRPASRRGSFFIPTRNVTVGDRDGEGTSLDRIRTGDIRSRLSGLRGL